MFFTGTDPFSNHNLTEFQFPLSYQTVRIVRESLKFVCRAFTKEPTEQADWSGGIKNG